MPENDAFHFLPPGRQIPNHINRLLLRPARLCIGAREPGILRTKTSKHESRGLKAGHKLRAYHILVPLKTVVKRLQREDSRLSGLFGLATQDLIQVFDEDIRRGWVWRCAIQGIGNLAVEVM